LQFFAFTGEQLDQVQDGTECEAACRDLELRDVDRAQSQGPGIPPPLADRPICKKPA